MAVTFVMAWFIATGAIVTLSAAALLVSASVMPAAIMLGVWHGAPPPTVGELLYAVNRT